MNCGKFEKIIDDLARAHVTDAAMRADAVAHAEACARCSARLADERALTQALRAFAAANENIEAPPQLETKLRAAFQKRSAHHAAAAAVSPSPALASAARAFKLKTPPRRIAWAAIAAMLLAAIGLTTATRSFYKQRMMETTAVTTENSNTPPSSTPDPGAQEDKAGLQNTMPPVFPNAGQRTASGGTPKYARYAAAANSADRNIARRNDRSKRLRRGSHAGSTNDTPAVGSEEIATEFLPLMDANNPAAQDGGQLVRVELPRSALLTFGLPMNIERIDEPIKADVLVGQNGLARAIRFVR